MLATASLLLQAVGFFVRQPVDLSRFLAWHDMGWKVLANVSPFALMGVTLVLLVNAVIARVRPPAAANRGTAHVTPPPRLPSKQWESRGLFKYDGVLWDVLVPRSIAEGVRLMQQMGGPASPIEPNYFMAVVPPHCPECETELTQSIGMLGKYVWACGRCRFRVRRKDDFQRAAEQASRVFRSTYKEKLG